MAAAVIVVAVVLAVAWIAAGCAVVPAGARVGAPRETISARFPGGETRTSEVLTTELGVAMGVARVPLDAAAVASDGMTVVGFYSSGNRACHRLAGVHATTRDGHIELVVEEGVPAALVVSCSAELRWYAVSATLPGPVDPSLPPPVFDGVTDRPVPVAVVLP